MSLIEETTGLLGTLVTWDDVQKDCLKVFGEFANLGSKKTITDIADGKGFVSRIGVVEDPWEDSALAELNDCPKKFVVKMATALQQEKYQKQLESDIGTDKKFMDDEGVAENVKVIKRIHNVECAIYEKLADVDDLPKLKVYASHPFSEENPTSGYLLMEFVENLINMGNENYLEEDVVLQILKTLAKYHSCSLLFDEKEKERFTIGIVKDLFGTMLAPTFVDTCLDLVDKFLGEEGEKTVEQLRNCVAVIVTEENRKKFDNMAELTGMQRVLCHGDPWTCNVICTANPIKLHALIDLQTTHFGCMGHDLARLFSNVLSYEDRDEKATDYIDKYFEYFTAYWPQNVELPYTKEQIFRSYESYLPLSTYIVAASIAALGEMRCKQSKKPEETRTIIQKKIVDLARNMEEKLHCLESIQLKN